VTIYSLVETAKFNGLVVEKYLVYLMDVLCNLEIKSKDTLLKHMPWSNELPEEFLVAVKGHKGWEKDLDKPIPYSIVVSFELLDGNIDIYNLIRIENQIEIENQQQIEAIFN